MSARGRTGHVALLARRPVAATIAGQRIWSTRNVPFPVAFNPEKGRDVVPPGAISTQATAAPRKKLQPIAVDAGPAAASRTAPGWTPWSGQVAAGRKIRRGVRNIL